MHAKAMALPGHGEQKPVAWAATDEDGKVEALGMNQSRRFDTPLCTRPAPQATQGQRECIVEDCGWTDATNRMCGSVGPLCPRCGEITEIAQPAQAERETTGHAEADRTTGRLASSDPDFDDCADAVALIVKLVAEVKGPEGYATWRDAATAERAACAALSTVPMEGDALTEIDDLLRGCHKNHAGDGYHKGRIEQARAAIAAMGNKETTCKD